MFLWSKGMNDVCTYTLFIVYTQLLRFVYVNGVTGAPECRRRSNDEISNILLETQGIFLPTGKQNVHFIFF